MCGAFEKTDGWALASVATIPVSSTAGADAVYGVWFTASQSAFLYLNKIAVGDTTINLNTGAFNLPYATTPTATTPALAALATAAQTFAIGGEDGDYGLAPNNFYVGAADAIASGTQTLYTYAL